MPGRKGVSLPIRVPAVRITLRRTRVDLLRAEGRATAGGSVEKTFDAFVRIVVSVLMVLMGFVVVLSVVDLAWNLVRYLVEDFAALPAVAGLFDVFGLFLVVLIGLELLESIRSYVTKHVVRVEVLLLAALMAIARKVIVLDLAQTSPLLLFGLATLILALSSGYFLLRRRKAPESTPAQAARAQPPKG